ncbi:tetratricopeptide repeat protein [bacterium]|nr:tetratricopeptide repeat protein [bacterium]
MKLALVLVLLMCKSVLANTVFEAGLLAYNKEDWTGAIQQWESITASGQTSASVEYNLGNAYFRLGNIERAILHYERSLKLNPGDDDAIKNLALANRGIVDQIATAPKLGVWSYLISVRDYFSLGLLRTLLIVSNACLAVIVGVIIYANDRVREIANRAVLLFAGLAVIVLFLYSWRSSALTNPYAIVMVEKTDVYSSPSENSTQLFSLHAGTKVSIGEKLSAWTEIQLTDGRKGWIASDDVETI